MARATNMLLMLVGCIVLATAVSAATVNTVTKDYVFEFFEHEGGDVQSFGSDKNELPGQGFIYDNRCTKTADPNSELYGWFGGLYFYSSPQKAHEVVSIYFEDINEKGGVFAEAEIHLRGIWNLDSDGNDLPSQTYAIVGGTHGLAGAYGSVKSTKVADKTWLIQGSIKVDVVVSSTKGPHMSKIFSSV